MVFDTAKLKNRESTIRPLTRGRDAAKELILKVDTLLVFTIDFSEIQSVVSHNSQSDGQNKSAKRWTSFQKEIIQVVSFQRNGFVYSRWRSTVTHGECRRRHFIRHFSHVCTFTHNQMWILTAWFKTSHWTCLHVRVIPRTMRSVAPWRYP